ncbi:MAG: hypothetical protein M3288_00930 [Thermoproteota archaeon]|nr:hypothetical protein [Thermoproteota archaeon]
MTSTELMQEIQNILRREPSKMYSREEILNLLAPKKRDYEIERLLAELEVTSSLREGKSDVYSTCRGGTVYYKWNNNTTNND